MTIIHINKLSSHLDSKRIKKLIVIIIFIELIDNLVKFKTFDLLNALTISIYI